MDASLPILLVAFTKGLIASTKAFPASTDTPAEAYVRFELLGPAEEPSASALSALIEFCS